MTSTQRACRTMLMLSLTVGFAAAGHGLAGAHHQVSLASIFVALIVAAIPARYAVRRPLRVGSGLMTVLGLQAVSHVAFALVPLMAAGASLGAGHHDMAMTSTDASMSLGAGLMASVTPAMVAFHAVAALCVAALWSAADAAAVALDRWLSLVLHQSVTLAAPRTRVCACITRLRSIVFALRVPIRGPPALTS
ncbi:hypothetical protein K0651_10040 [Ornithinimicrobium sp. Arc0846-15]|nr:hypothetical protein [Ornithinimicrobium laminariae]